GLFVLTAEPRSAEGIRPPAERGVEGAIAEVVARRDRSACGEQGHSDDAAAYDGWRWRASDLRGALGSWADKPSCQDRASELPPLIPT
ncbi:hypothetical protein THAOC_20217, partial [Thalassiosira oceanica]